MSVFFQRLFETRPDFKGRHVYYCPTFQLSLECIVNEDATISLACAPFIRFDAANTFAQALINGQLNEFTDFRMPKRIDPNSVVFSTDFFVEPGRKTRLRDLFPMATPKPVGKLTPTRRSRRKKGVGQPIILATTATTAQLPAVYAQPMEETTAAGSTTGLENPLSFISGANGGQEPMEEAPIQVIIVATAPMTAEVQSVVEPLAGSGSMLTANYQTLTKPCVGLERARYADVLADKLWDSGRIEFSPVVIGESRLWSKRCRRNVAGFRDLCAECIAARRNLIRHRITPRVVNDEQRILNTGNKWLTTDEQLKKAEILVKRHQDKFKALQKQLRRIQTLEMELKRYRPESGENRLAVRSLVKHLESDSKLRKSPVCEWEMETEAGGRAPVCGYEADSSRALRQHVREAHLTPQLNNDGNANPKYACKWSKCGRRAPFIRQRPFFRHIANHIGNPATEQRVANLREQLINLGRNPTGRRFSRNFLQTLATRFTIPKEYELLRTTSSLPIPALASIVAFRNNPGAENRPEVVETLVGECSEDESDVDGESEFGDGTMEEIIEMVATGVEDSVGPIRNYDTLADTVEAVGSGRNGALAVGTAQASEDDA